jgi:hypothetical protein
MPLSVRCECGNAYRVSEEKAGRRFKCKNCGATLQVRDGERSPSTPTAGATRGLPPRVSQKRKSDKKLARQHKPKTESGFRWSLTNPASWGIALLGVFVLVSLLTAISGRAGYVLAVIALLAGGAVIATAVGCVLIDAFEEEYMTGLACLVIPFYWPYFALSHSEESRKWLLASILATLVIVDAQVALGVSLGVKRGFSSPALVSPSKEAAQRTGPPAGAAATQGNANPFEPDASSPDIASDSVEIERIAPGQAIAQLRQLGVGFSTNQIPGGLFADFGLIRGEFNNEKLALLHSLPEQPPLVGIRLPEGGTDEGLQYVVGLPHLKVLAITSHHVTPSGLQQLGVMESLEKLIVSSRKLTQSDIDQLKQQLPGCDIQLKR